MRIIIVAGACIAASAAFAGTVEQSPRPVERPKTVVQEVKVTTSDQSFEGWLQGFRERASVQGVSAATLDTALRGISYDAEVVRRDRNQNEFTKTIWDYLGTAVSDARIANGKAALTKHRESLEAIEEKYGVDKQILVAIWGLESAYGGFRGNHSVVQSLATLAYDPRRSEFFEGQLLNALQILDAGDTTPARMKGSWAGAMGHTQFMPSSFLDHAVDYTGDGKRDIWGDDPRDALASAAAYLKHHGWTKGQPWGVEVRLPGDFEYTQANREITRLPSEWAARGIVAWDGSPVPDHGRASILLPAGHQGAAFMIFDNFEVLEAYNTADAYVIGVGHLGDRILGGPAIKGGWPTSDRALTYDERIELQTRLTRAGFDTKKIDARIGPLTIAAVRAWQVSEGLVPDGYASPAALSRLRQVN
ncbi:MAG: lytic murein transglycosylase [Paracoccaceae bacterium]